MYVKSVFEVVCLVDAGGCLVVAVESSARAALSSTRRETGSRRLANEAGRADARGRHFTVADARSDQWG